MVSHLKLVKRTCPKCNQETNEKIVTLSIEGLSKTKARFHPTIVDLLGDHCSNCGYSNTIKINDPRLPHNQKV
jgi:type II secretory ATPase GspE/PulE/Tfp pilus assembly ATPase PilB-like protein